VIACGTAKVIDKIARDGAEEIEIETHRTLLPVLKELKAAGMDWTEVLAEEVENRRARLATEI